MTIPTSAPEIERKASMNFHSPDRKRLANTRPLWLSDSSALPNPSFCPTGQTDEGQRTYDMDVMINPQMHYVRGMTFDEIQEFLIEWEDDPEEACRKWLKCEPPQRGQRADPAYEFKAKATAEGLKTSSEKSAAEILGF